jgi:hypothetical protein
MPMGWILDCDWADAALSQVECVFSDGSTSLRQIRDAWSGKDYAIRAREVLCCALPTSLFCLHPLSRV